ncbi:MAG: helix-turn-helix domain-containing protein [Alphaproteobacteria bacterium]|nr:helix-turn-helix domain-containing protein [Alphaproteobacteria bacterium]MBU1512726.1 helix-turn-helix domain-containing protein [Alphaproteobacteria bacterium]MBU2096105.1 helix-turn-helix domain-containing protein [Alphaproteobacteria bacterium]MBU2152461.1 helix-turn-helix domain-containing protein [Alphaproteobacteria bacterium]MBU2308005.1 helix-turn-helix domain-containing protein [Alphaproteobacteria bacterium]
MPCFPVLEFDSHTLPPDERFPTFASGMVNFDLTAPAAAPFAAVATAWKVGAIVIAEIRSSPVRYDRSSARILRDEVDHLYVNLHLKGRVVADCGAGARIGSPGSLLVVDMRQACEFEVADVHEIAVAIPRRLLVPRLQPFDAHGLLTRGPLVRLLGRSLQAVLRSLPELAPGQSGVVERMVVDQVCDTLLDALRAGEAGRAREATLTVRVHALMDAHLAEPIDPAWICATLGVSRSALYRAFEDKGGVLRDLQVRRLRRVRAWLETPGETRPIAALAALTGFADKAHLTRAFKREFGLTPGEVRARAGETREVAPAVDDQAARLFNQWVSALD